MVYIEVFMDSQEIRKRFFDFFTRHGHTLVPSSSLIPDDPSVLLTTAGMQQFKPYYTGEINPMTAIHPTLGKPLGAFSTVSIQKSFRTSDIDAIGDDTHCTFFEMLGNFSFGGYFKKEAIAFAHEFITKELRLEISYVTIFEGKSDIGVPRDEESEKIWRSLDPDIKIIEQGMEDVFWGPTGSSGPCGPTTEIYCKNASGDDVEIWNIVFNEYFYSGSRDELLGRETPKSLEKLKTPGVDTGMGLERLAMVVQKTKSIFETDLFAPFLTLLPHTVPVRERRIIVDHLRGIVFLLGDGVRPSNKEVGYILRRLMRRVLAYAYIYELPDHVLDSLIHDVTHDYGKFYIELMRNVLNIHEAFKEERIKFAHTLAKGIKELERIKEKGTMNIKEAFDVYQTFGLSFEIIRDVGGKSTSELTLDAFQEEFKKHQDTSRAGREGKFGGHGLVLDTGELKARDAAELKKVTRLHSATHLLHAALRAVLGHDIRQMGSDITAERMRFDFNFPRKLEKSELQKISDFVNDAITKDLMVTREEMSYKEAQKSGALHFFQEKYPEQVSVYTFTDKQGDVISRELCGGPHVTHTHTIGKFTILKEEASSAGVRRIRAFVEP